MIGLVGIKSPYVGWAGSVCRRLRRKVSRAEEAGY